MDDYIECGICLEKIDEYNNYAITPCGHKFCFNCILQSIQTINTCPYCREILINIEEIEENIDNSTYFDKILRFINRIINHGFTTNELFYFVTLLFIKNYSYIMKINNNINNIDNILKNIYFKEEFYNNNTFI
jgi:TM2 domain-containing membrane protein YozV